MCVEKGELGKGEQTRQRSRCCPALEEGSEHPMGSTWNSGFLVGELQGEEREMSRDEAL